MTADRSHYHSIPKLAPDSCRGCVAIRSPGLCRDLSECEDDDARKFAVLDYLQDNTQICGEYGGEDGHYVVYCSAF